MCGDSRHDLNYPEIPDSWGELFENLEQLTFAEVQKMKREDLWIERRTWEWHTGGTKTQRVQVRFTVEDLKRVEEMAASLGKSRVEFIRSAIDYVVRNLEVQA